MKKRVSSFLQLHRTGDLEKRASIAEATMRSCSVCPRNCGVDRTSGEIGACGIGEDAVVASTGPHFGEEGPLVGYNGSGTIFFSGCNLKCIFCQNHDISQNIRGKKMDPDELADVMMTLQEKGCHNINLVSPSHVVPQILKALVRACERGLKVPLVYNTGGYDSVKTLVLLDGIVDIYMPDMKYVDPVVGKHLSGVPDYPEVNQRAVKEMHRQVGDLVMDGSGIALKGLVVRHLVLPEGLAGTGEVTTFLANEVSKDTYINVMSQYRPEFRAFKDPVLSRHVTTSEYRYAVNAAREAGLWRFDRI